MISELKTLVENKSNVSIENLKMVLKKLENQKVSSSQALDILQCCAFARFNQDQSNVTNKLWEQLKQQKNELQSQHYACMLQFHANKGNIAETQAIFDDLIESGFKPDA